MIHANTKAVAALLIGLLSIQPAFSGAEDDAKEFYAKKAEESLRHLDYGTLDQKILAVYFMGASKKARFVRPLGRELLDQLDNPDMRQLSVNDPYVKAHIAWALGQIDHKAGVPYLLEALEKTLAIVEEKRQAVQQARQNRSATSHEFIIEQDEPGPFLSSTEMVDPYSPDVYWSVADAFKATPAILLTAEDHRARLRGFNYVNVIQHILIALGKIKDPEVSDRVAQLLDHPYPSIRKEAALTLGKLGNLGSLEALERAYNNEKDPEARTRIAFSIFHNDHTRVKYYQDLLQMLKDNDQRVRLEAAKALRELALGESITPLYQAYRLEESLLVRSVIDQAIRNAELDNLFPPNPLIQTGPTRIWTYGRPYRPDK